MSENAKKKNIIYIFNDSGVGGAAMSLLDILVEIKKYINPVVIMPDYASNEVDKRFNELSVIYYKIHFSNDYAKIGSTDKNKKILDFKQSYEAAMQLIPIIKKENIDLIHINSSTSYFAAIAALMVRIPYVWHIRELIEKHLNCEFINEELKVSLYKRADRLIAISNYVKESYLNKYGLETVQLYDGLEVERFKRDLTTKNKFDNSFIVVAMITPEKGQWDVVQAVELLMKEGHDDINVVIVGNGAYNYVWALKKYIKEKKLEKNIIVLPFHENLSQLRSRASYAITSSQDEALGRVTIEAMLAGNIVIGARSGATTEIIGEDEERGFLYELGNNRALADAMVRAMDYSVRKKNILLLEAQKYAESEFDSKEYCGKLLKIYDEVILAFEVQQDDKFLDDLKKGYYSIKDMVYENMDIIDVPYIKSALMLPLVSKWLEIRQMGQSLCEYFYLNNIQNIAIYGMGVLGCRLYDELEGSSVQVRYLIDKSPNGIDKIFEFSELDKEKLDVETIVVTVISSEIQIINEIKTFGYKHVIGLSEIINSFQ